MAWYLPSGNKPSPEPMLTQVYVYMASLGDKELMNRNILMIYALDDVYTAGNIFNL